MKSTTDICTQYSGHGLPAEDNQGIYIFQQRADRDLAGGTAIPLRKVNVAPQFARPRSVTTFMDARYSE